MKQTSTEQTNPGLRSWSITKSEWDGYGRTTPASGWLRWSSAILTTLLGCTFLAMPLVFGALRNTAVPSSVWWIFGTVGAGFLVVPPLLTLWSSRQERKWRALQAVIWESNGCVCPWCRVRVDETPCATHGFNRDDQPKLIAYWECLPQFAHTDAVRAIEVLTATARRRPRSWAVIGPLRRMARASLASQHDARLAPLQRLRAALPWMTVKLVAGIALLALAYQLLPRQFFASFLSGCWPFLLMGPILLLIGPMWRVGKLRCSACNHLCASAQPTVCTECGADLTQPAAVVRHERAPKRRLVFFVVPLLLFALLPVFQDSIIAVLPAPIRNAIWTEVRPPSSYWQNLTPATMTQAEVDEAATLLAQCARPGRGRPLFDFEFLDSARQAGKLTDEILERTARATVQATLEAGVEVGRASATVRPSFGELVLPGAMTPRLVFGGVSVDGGPWTPPADWSLFLHDVEEFWRANGQLKALPEEMLVFRADLGPLPAGPHVVRARCWIVLHERAWVRYAPEFDASGALIPPVGATVFELPLEVAFTAG